MSLTWVCLVLAAGAVVGYVFGDGRRSGSPGARAADVIVDALSRLEDRWETARAAPNDGLTCRRAPRESRPPLPPLARACECGARSARECRCLTGGWFEGPVDPGAGPLR